MQQAPSLDAIRTVAPAFQHYTTEIVLGDLWKRPQLSPRDRSVVTVAALIARNQTIDLAFYMGLALDSGVTPCEISEIITHLAFYAGWSNGAAAASVASAVFNERGIGAREISPTQAEPLPLNEAAEAARASAVAQNFGAVAPGVVQYTTDALFRDLWLRAGLAPRDRSLVTVSALVANGQAAQIPYHLNRALDNGLTKDQASEVLTQLAFHAGWPSAFSAMPVFKDVFEKRA
jgi:4-carboxymuconolactone decarboxylase